MVTKQYLITLLLACSIGINATDSRIGQELLQLSNSEIKVPVTLQESSDKETNSTEPKSSLINQKRLERTLRYSMLVAAYAAGYVTLDGYIAQNIIPLMIKEEIDEQNLNEVFYTKKIELEKIPIVNQIAHRIPFDIKMKIDTTGLTTALYHSILECRLELEEKENPLTLVQFLSNALGEICDIKPRKNMKLFNDVITELMNRYKNQIEQTTSFMLNAMHVQSMNKIENSTKQKIKNIDREIKTLEKKANAACTLLNTLHNDIVDDQAKIQLKNATNLLHEHATKKLASLRADLEQTKTLLPTNNIEFIKACVSEASYVATANIIHYVLKKIDPSKSDAINFLIPSNTEPSTSLQWFIKFAMLIGTKDLARHIKELTTHEIPKIDPTGCLLGHE